MMTKSPWYYSGFSGIMAADWTIVDSTMRNVIAVCPRGDLDELEYMANVVAMTQSPLMVKALEAVAREYEYRSSHARGLSVPEKKLWQEIREVLDKVHGRAA